MINKIAHLADIHIENTNRHDEYRIVFNRLAESLKSDNPDRIVIVGDLFDNFIDISNEAKILASELLNRLSNIAKVYITRGNHDIRKKNLKRVDSVESIVRILNNPNVVYLNSTGFVEDDNVVWAVWHHGDKRTPWTKDYERIDGKIYIDLFHDPISGAIKSNDNGSSIEFKSKTYFNVSDFKGDFSFFGDIHQRQYFKEGTKAYSGSLVQRDFGETINGHGYLLWDISTGECIEKDIPNDYSFLTVRVGRFADYDNLDLKDEYPKPTENVRVRVKWESLPVNHTRLNEQKISNYLIKEYNPIFYKFNKEVISENDLQKYTENNGLQDIDPMNIENIFREYLTENGYEEGFINDLLGVDKIITQRLNLPPRLNNYFKIKKIKAINFQAYEEFEVNFEDLGSIIQIEGLNQVGKTTWMNAITYLLHGEKQETYGKRKKFKDNTFINNKRDLDYCEVTGIIDINGQNFGLSRRTTRKWNRDKTEITACPTTLEFYEILNGELDLNTPLTGEKRKDTQELINKTIGSYDEFVRISLTTADNLNSLLSQDRAEFMDNILRDAGLDVFEKKGKEFKEYKKEEEAKTERINLNLDIAETTITGYREKIEELKTHIKNKEDEVTILKGRISEGNDYKDALIQAIHPIDPEISSLDPTDIREKIVGIETREKEFIDRANSLETDIKHLPYDYNRERIEEINSTQEKFKESVYQNKMKIKDIERSIMEYENDFNRANTDITRSTNEIESLKNNIYEIAQYYLKSREESFLNTIELKKTDVIYRETFVRTCLNEINNLENSKNCPTCDRPLGKEQQESINLRIAEKQNEIESSKQEIAVLNKTISKNEKNLEKVKEFSLSLHNIKIEDVSDFLSDHGTKEKISKVFHEIGDKKRLISELEDKKNKIRLDLENFKDKISVIERKMEEETSKMEKISMELASLNEEKFKTETREKIQNELDTIPLKLELLIHEKKVLQDKLDEFNKQQLKIEENITTQSKILGANAKLDTLWGELESKNNEKSLMTQEITNLEEKINDLINRLEVFKTQQYRDELFRVYQNCVHREGIPMVMLKKSLNLINMHISNILSDTSVKAFFDDNVELKMFDQRWPDILLDAVESSGKERTFISTALKIALREINTTAKGNIFLLDEVTGKLTDKSVEEFNDILLKIRDMVEHIFIIEHHNTINFDNILEVVRNEHGISTIKLVA